MPYSGRVYSGKVTFLRVGKDYHHFMIDNQYYVVLLAQKELRPLAYFEWAGLVREALTNGLVVTVTLSETLPYQVLEIALSATSP